MASRGLAVVLTLALLLSPTAASAHTPDWLSRLAEWLLGRKLGEAPSAGWLEPRPAPDFRLVDQHGQAVALAGLRRRVVLLNFAYAGCRDACASMRELKLLERTLGGRMGTDVLFVSITLDPARDTAEALRAFGQRVGIGPGWKLLTGPPEVVGRLASAYGVYVRRIDDGRPPAGPTLEYGDVILFLDQEGRLRKRVLPHVLQLSGRVDVEWLLERHGHD